MATLADARTAQQVLALQLGRQPWLRGIGVSGRPGSYSVAVRVDQTSDLRRLPAAVFGVPVEGRAVGRISVFGVDPPGFRPGVLDTFLPTTDSLEKRVNYMYQDSRSFVTTASGVKIDPIELVYDPYIPAGSWLRPDGSAASSDEIGVCWAAVKANTNPDLFSTGAPGIFGNTLRLTDDAVGLINRKKANLFCALLLKQLPDIADWPADAQLGLLLAAWGTGPNIIANPGFMAPFVAAIKVGDFATAAATAVWKNVNPDRRQAMQTAFMNAAAVAQQGADPSGLNFPTSIGADPPDPMPTGLSHLPPATVQSAALRLIAGGSTNPTIVQAFQFAWNGSGRTPKLPTDGVLGDATKRALSFASRPAPPPATTPASTPAQAVGSAAAAPTAPLPAPTPAALPTSTVSLPAPLPAAYPVLPRSLPFESVLMGAGFVGFLGLILYSARNRTAPTVTSGGPTPG